MNCRPSIALCTLATLALSCNPAPAAKATDGISNADQDFIRYDPKKVPLDFIKIESAVTTHPSAATMLTGRVMLDEDHTQRLASPIDGRAVSLFVKLGDTVKNGQALIQLSSPNVGALQADAQKAASDLKVSSQALDRAHRLKADGAIADKDVAQAEGDYRKVKSELARSRAQLTAFGISPADPTVSVALHARMSGTIIERNVLVGQEVRGDQATPLLTISNLDTVWVVADVYEPDLGLVGLGDAVQVEVPAYPGESFRGKVTSIGATLDPGTRTVKVRCAVPNPGLRLKPEMFARLAINGSKASNRIMVPAKAVLSDGDRSTVIVASEGVLFRVRPVDVGAELEGMVPILRGLSPGEEIVTNGAIFLKREIESQ